MERQIHPQAELAGFCEGEITLSILAEARIQKRN
jgi:hypothetical protein